MDSNGQVYFGPESSIPPLDVERLREAILADREHQLEAETRLIRKRLERDYGTPGS